MNHHFDAFVDDLRASHGSNLVSVILYGSAAAGDFVPKRSDYNLLVALNTIGPDDLRKAHACVREWAKLGNPIPVYFTVSELKNGADVFPIEFDQMRQARRVLFGPDLLGEIEISEKFLRLQAEFELRSKLLQLRRQYIPASSSVEKLTALMANSLSSFAALFRAVLKVYGIEPPVTKREVVAMTAQTIGIDGTPFEKIFNIRKDNFAFELDEAAANALFGEYLIEIEKVIDAVDRSKKD